MEFFWIACGIGVSSNLTPKSYGKPLFNNLMSDDKVRLQQEKEIVVDFMHNLAVAIGEGIAKKIYTKELLIRRSSQLGP